MGLDVQSLRLLLLARRMGAKFDRTITLGRQDLLVTTNQLTGICKAFDIQLSEQEANQIAIEKNRFCEPLLEKLGAGTVDSIDASGFEGANLIYDLNQSLPAELDFQYSLVFDGGTLEHIFNFPTAIRSCMRMVAVGGHFIMTSPANNQMGHGFYQFSPDLLYRVFSQENGYKLKALFLAPTFSDGQWFKVFDPATVRSRVGYNSCLEEMSLFAIAERLSPLPPFSRSPQQSDYVSEWLNTPEKSHDSSRLSFFDQAATSANWTPAGWGSIKHYIRNLVPQSALSLLRTMRVAQRAMKPPNPAHFEPFHMPPDA
jgi:hypothetical protein